MYVHRLKLGPGLPLSSDFVVVIVSGFFCMIFPDEVLLFRKYPHKIDYFLFWI